MFFYLNIELAKCKIKMVEIQDTSTLAGANQALTHLSQARQKLAHVEKVEEAQAIVHDQEEEIATLKETLEKFDNSLNSEKGLHEAEMLLKDAEGRGWTEKE